MQKKEKGKKEVKDEQEKKDRGRTGAGWFD
jgi:hypothetical protein